MIKGNATDVPTDRSVRSGELFGRPVIGQPSVPFFPAAGHEEALARLLFLAEYGRAGGLLVGRRGVGKTTVLREAAHELRLGRRAFVHLDVAGLNADGVRSAILAAAGLPTLNNESAVDCEMRIRSHLHGQQMIGLPVVFLVDNVDEADSCGIKQLDRILRLADPALGSITVLGTATDAIQAMSLDWLDRHAELRIDVTPFEAIEIANYLADECSRSQDTYEFTASAVEKITSVSAGIPRDVNRIARLAVLAAEADDRSEITDHLIGLVVNEMPSVARLPELASA